MTTCDGCGQTITLGETVVHADGDATYHMGCEFSCVHHEIGAGESVTGGDP